MPNWKRRAYLITAPSVIFLAAVSLVILRAFIDPITDPDFFWHLSNGNNLLALLHLFGNDPYTYTVPAHHWVMHEWLSEVLFAVLYKIGNLGAVVVFIALATWLGFLFILLRCRMEGANPFVLGTGLILGAIAGYPVWGPRDQMYTFMFTALLLLLVERHIRKGGKLIWLLVPIFIVWGNMHSAFTAGLLFFGIIVAAEILSAVIRREDALSTRRIVELACCLVCCVAATMINANGPEILIYPIFTQFSAAQQMYIEEWQSPDFQYNLLVPYEMLLISGAAFMTRARAMKIRDLLLVLLVIAMSLQSVRHISFAILVILPLWVRNASVVFEQFMAWLRIEVPARIERSLGESRTPRSRAPLPPAPLFFRVVVALIIVVGLAVIPAKGFAAAVPVTPTSEFYLSQYPVCAAEWLAESKVPLRVFNQYGDGGYLTYALSQHGDKIFIFGDAALMGNAQIYNYGHIQNLQPDWEKLALAHGTDVILFERGAAISNLIANDPDWVQVYEDPKAAVYVPAASYASLASLLPPPPAPGSSVGSCIQEMEANE